MTTVMRPNSMPGTSVPNSDSSVHCAQFQASPFLPPDSTDTPKSSSCRPHKPQLVHSSYATAPSAHNPGDRQSSRKRPRLSTKTPRNDADTTSRSAQYDAISPSPLVNTNYRIAGGLDTPSAFSLQREEDAHEFDYEIDCRPSRYSRPNLRPASDSYFPQTPALDDNRKHTRRLSPPSPPIKGWGQAVWALTGGFAGKVINFCWATTFQGFHAGGGNGYRFDVGTPGVASSAWTEVDSREDVFHNDYNGRPGRGDRESTPVPGEFPADEPEFIEDYMSMLTVNQKHTTTPTPTRQGRKDAPQPSRYNSWVVIDPVDGDRGSRESSPVHKKSKASTANLYAAQPSPAFRHSSHPLTRPRLTPRTSSGRSSASYASARASLGPDFSTAHLTRQSISSNPTSDLQQNEACREKRSLSRPSSSHANRRSHLSPSRRSSIHSNTGQKPSPEVRKFEQKLRKKEKVQDRTMNNFNDRLQEMIREGQAALGSRVEVEMEEDDEDEDLDEGYYEDGYRKSTSAAWQRDDNRHWSRS